MALDFDSITATTFKNYRRTMADNIMKNIGLLAFMQKGGQIERRQGGNKIVEPLMYGLNSTFMTFSGYDVLLTSPQEGMSAAEFSWKNAAVAVTISKEEEMQNSGESRIINLLKEKIKQAQKTFELRLEQMLFGDGTGNGSKDFAGLDAYLTTAASTAGGIDGSTYTWWDNVRATSSNFSTNGLSTMRSVYNQTIRGGDKPNMLVTDRTTYEAYEGLLTPIERVQYSKGKELAGDLGFESLMFKGTPIMWSYYADASKIYFLNTDYLKLVVDSRMDFNMSEWRVPVNQLARTAFITLRGELICNNRQQQGLMSITAYS
jgi:hypothetical protein